MNDEDAEDAGGAVPAPLLGELLPPETPLPQQPAWQEFLTAKEIAFVDQYFICRFNASAAARALGLNEGAGFKIRHSPRVVAAIDKALAQNSIGRQTVIESIAAIMNAELRDVATWDEGGKVVFRGSADISASGHAAITGLKVDVESGRIERIQMDGKLQMISLLAKILGLVGSDPAISVTGNNVQIVLSKEDQQVL